jgi:hypothetical protein
MARAAWRRKRRRRDGARGRRRIAVQHVGRNTLFRLFQALR